MIGVLDLGLGQGGLAGGAPVDRLLPLVQGAVAHEDRQLPHDLGLVSVVEREVGALPGPEHAEALELVALDGDEPLGVSAALIPDLRFGHLLFAGAEDFVHLVLDGEAVAIPARDIRAQIAAHRLGFDHEVLEDLVQGRADVNVPVRVRGAVVQDEAVGVAARLLDTVVEPLLVPLRD